MPHKFVTEQTDSGAFGGLNLSFCSNTLLVCYLHCPLKDYNPFMENGPLALQLCLWPSGRMLPLYAVVGA